MAICMPIGKAPSSRSMLEAERASWLLKNAAKQDPVVQLPPGGYLRHVGAHDGELSIRYAWLWWFTWIGGGRDLSDGESGSNAHANETAQDSKQKRGQ